MMLTFSVMLLSFIIIKVDVMIVILAVINFLTRILLKIGLFTLG
jgi:hypothetical protein